MGGDHHHHGPPYKIPDYRIYKVDDIPRLVHVRDVLARQGLKDPWLRNEVFRFQASPRFEPLKHVWKTVSVGMKKGFIIAVGITVAGEVYSRTIGKDEHGHGAEGGHH